MINGQTVLVVVPARGGSKGIPLKNLREVAGRSLVARVGDVIREVPYIDRAVVSTDHDKIAAVAEQAGIAAPFRRPEAISGDRIGDIDVLIDALQQTERIDGKTYDIIVMLQPTSPMRRAADVTATIEKLVSDKLDAVWTVSETDSKGHPLKQLTIEGNRLDLYDQRGHAIIARQQLAPVYHRNGVAYAMTRDCLMRQKTLMGTRTAAHVVTTHQISIDTEWDIALAEFVLSRLADGEKPGKKTA